LVIVYGIPIVNINTNVEAFISRSKTAMRMAMKVPSPMSSAIPRLNRKVHEGDWLMVLDNFRARTIMCCFIYIMDFQNVVITIPFDKTLILRALAYFVRVVVPFNPKFITLEPPKDIKAFCNTTKGKVPEHVYIVFVVNLTVPPFDKPLVHFFNTVPRAVTVLVDMFVIEMGVTREPSCH
jgi:hypothetical protein